MEVDRAQDQVGNGAAKLQQNGRVDELEPFQVVQTILPSRYAFWIFSWKEKTPKRRYQ